LVGVFNYQDVMYIVKTKKIVFLTFALQLDLLSRISQY